MQPWMIAIFVPLGVIAIPIVAMFNAHQRKMAEIIHKGQSVPAGELEAIRQELRELRGLVNQQTIALDDIRGKQSSTQTDVQNRLGISQ